MIRKIASVLLLVIWLGVIFSFSNADGETSSGMSERLIKFITVTITDTEPNSEEMEKIVEKYSFPVRKLAHFTEYFIFGLIVVNLLASFKIRKKMLLYVIVISLASSLFDEFHQTFIAGRSGNIKDVLLDTSGALIGAYLVHRFYLYRCYFK